MAKLMAYVIILRTAVLTVQSYIEICKLEHKELQEKLGNLLYPHGQK